MAAAAPAQARDIAGLVAQISREATLGLRRGGARTDALLERFGRVIHPEGPSESGLQAALQLSAEILAEALVADGETGRRSAAVLPEHERMLVTAGAGHLAIVLLSSRTGFTSSRLLPVDLPDPKAMYDAAGRLARGRIEQGGAASELLARLGADAAALAMTAAPDIIVTHLPRMEPLCVATPHTEIDCAGATSTAGIFCRDAQGRLGVTACLHGTGAAGTKVCVGVRDAAVAAHDPVQDIVFIPLPDDLNLPEMEGLGGVLADEAPPTASAVRFDGARSGKVSTHVSSMDVGLLRRRPTVQLKVQTPADTNHGDSGSALLDRSDRVIGFAFERSAYGEFPEITDWIWARNALDALQLTPFKI